MSIWTMRVTAWGPLVCLCCACGGGGSTGGGPSPGPPFTWDAGTEPPACAVQDCLSYVTGQCPDQSPAMCTGSSEHLTSNAIVYDVCFKNGSKQTITNYASSIDAVAYRADGTQCLHELSDSSGTVTFEDTSGRVVGTMDFHSLDSFSCGGLHSTSLCGADAGRVNLVNLGACQGTTSTTPCP